MPERERDVCRDENCGLLHVHARHEVRRRVVEPLDHGGSQRRPWERNDPQGLLEAVVRAARNRPASLFQDIYRDVVDDYGQVTQRTVHRYVVKAVQDGRIVDVDVKLPAWRVYAEPGARVLRQSPEAIREYILAEHDHPALVQSRRSHALERHLPPSAPRSEPITPPVFNPKLRRLPRTKQVNTVPGCDADEEPTGYDKMLQHLPIAESAHPTGKDHG